MDTDVVIAGAGPVGLAMACELSRYGLSVRIVDKAAHRTDKSKAIVIWSRTLELMDRMGCTEQFIRTGLRVKRASVIADHKRLGSIELDGLATPYPFALLIPQSETERLLEEHLATFGTLVERGVELKSFESSEAGVSSNLVRADGSEENIVSRWLLGCDGAHSTVRHGLGMEFHGEALLSDWILADVHLSGAPIPQEITISWYSEGVLALFPLSETRYRIIANVGESTGQIGSGHRPDPTLAEVQSILDKRGTGSIQASDPVWLGSFSINERKVSEYRAGRVFLAGDAAHIHSPAGGQGMNTGIQDACNLAWKLALVTQGSCRESILASYSIERSAIATALLEATGKATTMAVMKSGVGQSIRNHAAALLFDLSPLRKMAANVLSEIAIGYHDSPLSKTASNLHHGPKAGERAPIREHEQPVGSAARFALCADESSDLQKILSQHADLLETALRAPFADDGVWVVRPDGYVGLVAKKGDFESVDSYLSGLSSRPLPL
jgi:2-polyprenyl-6-methoxyphenol hydroxylase-like FAD-dependent oxidoreductase